GALERVRRTGDGQRNAGRGRHPDLRRGGRPARHAQWVRRRHARHSGLYRHAGAMGIYRGISLLVTKGNAIVGLPKSFGRISEVDLLGILPLPLVIVITVAVLIHFTLNSTLPGRYCYAIGSNIEAVRYAGV